MKASPSYGAWCCQRTLEDQDREALLMHERAHVRHGHSFDVLFLRTIQAFNWFIPVWSWALRELKLVHEHTADAEARAHHADYETLLVAHAFGVPRHVLTNSFRSSDLKTRITMMLKRPSTTSARIKYLAAIPLVLLAIAIAAPMRSATPFQAPQTEVVSKAEVMPEFPGGMDGSIKYLGEEVKYPKPSAEGAVTPTGTVHVQFIVTTTGAVEKVTVKKGSSIELDMEAIRVVRGMPKWTPGKNDGKPVAVQMVLPIRFELS
ncbi:MAG: M56 family metallopeptidase [Flavobacteriales bacterium]